MGREPRQRGELSRQARAGAGRTQSSSTTRDHVNSAERENLEFQWSVGDRMKVVVPNQR